MHGYVRIEYQPDGRIRPGRRLYEGRFDIAEHDVIYAAHAFLNEYTPRDEGLELADVNLYVWPFDMREEPAADQFDDEDAIYKINGLLLIDQDDLDKGEDNPYPLVVKLQRMGALTSFSSSDQLVEAELKVVTFFYYECPGWGGSTTGGDTEEFLWRMNALQEGWEACLVAMAGTFTAQPNTEEN
jgi:hypothetical protein